MQFVPYASCSHLKLQRKKREEVHRSTSRPQSLMENYWLTKLNDCSPQVEEITGCSTLDMELRLKFEVTDTHVHTFHLG